MTDHTPDAGKKVALHDSDATGFPNLALMKLSAWHKAQGRDVEWFTALNRKNYSQVFSSKVFTFTDRDPHLSEDAILGGSGYGSKENLPDEIEHIMPDYSLYGINYSVGFLTRGCPRKCNWCIVPNKEGDVRAHADIEEFAAHRDVVLLDNNVLASDHGIKQIEKIVRLNLRVDFNQGLDARLIDDGIARLLSKVTFLSPLRLACDFSGMLPTIRKAVETLRWHNVTPRRYFCYVLVRELDDAIERVKALKGMDLDPFAQPYIPPDGSTPSNAQKAFARWVNHKAEFKSRCWEDYAAYHGVKT